MLKFPGRLTHSVHRPSTALAHQKPQLQTLGRDCRASNKQRPARVSNSPNCRATQSWPSVLGFMHKA